MNSLKLEEWAPHDGACHIHSSPKGLAVPPHYCFPWEGCSPSLPGDGRGHEPFPLWLPAFALPDSACLQGQREQMQKLHTQFTGQSLLQFLLKPFTFRIFWSATNGISALCFVQLCCLGRLLHTGGSATAGWNCFINLCTTQSSTPC